MLKRSLNLIATNGKRLIIIRPFPEYVGVASFHCGPVALRNEPFEHKEGYKKGASWNGSRDGGYRAGGNGSRDGGYRSRDGGSGGWKGGNDRSSGYGNKPYNSYQNYEPRRGGGGGGNYNNNQRGGKYSKKRSDSQDQEKVISRNRLSNKGGEGDGLRGLDDYEVDITKLRDMEWTDLLSTSEGAASTVDSETDIVPGEEAATTDSSTGSNASGFSNIPTLALAEHKVISRVLVNSLNYNRKYTSLTPVQAQTLIPILRNESVVVRAKTGTGKTAAFAIPTLQKVLEAKRRNVEGVKAVIISPTRELAQQIADEITAISSYGELRKIKTQCFVGGLSKDRQLMLGFVQKPVVDIVVATPGRLFDILQDDNVLKHFSGLRFKVLDEADRLLDIGFRNELDQIRDRLAEVLEDGEVPTLLFSATIDQTVKSFARDEFGQRAKIVDTVDKNEPSAAELVEQHAVICQNWAQMYVAGVQVIEKELHACSSAVEAGDANAMPFKAVIFMPSVMLVENFAKLINEYFTGKQNNFVHTLHGQMTQASRQRISDSYRKSRQSILITTDVVARGMDFPQVSHVFQIGIPNDVASYIHRIGRTARIGNTGKSYLIMSNYEIEYLNRLENTSKIVMKEIVQPFEPENAVQSRITEIAPDTVVDTEEANEIYNNVLISAGTLKRSYRIDGRKYLRDHESFGQLLGLETPILSGSVQRVWTDRRNIRSREGRGSFQGGTRRTRMKW